MEKEIKLAVLIDAENISSKYVDVILSEANAMGNIIYKRIYGNWTSPNMASWRSVILDNSIQPIQQYSNTMSKNSSDSSLIIDAMDLLYRGTVNCFCIVSSDSDFTRLATRLRESEMYVLGMGERKTPRSFISACNKFSYLDILYKSSKKADTPKSGVNPAKSKPAKKQPDTAAATKVPPAPPKEELPVDAAEAGGSNIDAVRRTMVQLVDEHSDDDGWIFSGKLGNLITKQFPDFDVRNFGFSRFVPFVESLGAFDKKRDENDPKLIYFKLK